MKDKTLWWLVLTTVLVKCLLASFVELNNDEVYYWTYAQKLQWNYFDHPPMIAGLIRLFTFNLHFQNDFFLRLGPIVCGAVNTWLIYLIGEKIKDRQTGLMAAFLYTASPYANLMAGFLLIPDAPQLVFWLWSILLMCKIITGRQHTSRMARRFLLLGITIGCCILSKIHGLFLWAGFFTYIIFYQRSLLRNPFLYYAIFLTALLILPIFYWNLSNNFISYRYHSSRVNFFSALHPQGWLREWLGEAIYNNPVSFTLLVMAVVATIKGENRIDVPARRLLFWLAFPLMGVVGFISLFSDTLPHWTGPAYTTLIPFTAAWLRSKQKETVFNLPGSLKWALSFTVLVLLLAVVVVKWLPFNLGSKEETHLGAGDPTLDMNGFKTFGRQLDSLYLADKRNGIMKSDAVVLSDYWFPAAHLDYYAARIYSLNFAAVGGLSAIHHYAWLNQARRFLRPGDDAYFISVSNYYNPPSPKLVRQFEKMEAPARITQYRMGVAVRLYFIYRLQNYRGNLPSTGVIENN